jgi:Lon protease-like protein
MFPLGRVLFPYALLPLHVFESRYRVMTRHVLAGDKEFGVVLIERGHEVGGGDTRFGVGSVARVVHAVEAPDGRYALTTVGTKRLQVVRWLDEDPFPQAEVVILDEPPARDADVVARRRVAAALAAVAGLARRIDPRAAPAPELDPDPVRASFEAAACAPIGALDAQRVLEASGAAARFSLLETLLGERATELRARLDAT